MKAGFHQQHNHNNSLCHHGGALDFLIGFQLEGLRGGGYRSQCNLYHPVVCRQETF